ncbi:MAG TPA: RES family NAD+ phosphorylase, partial [Thermoanaerobaculia bacterium]|nr:RES family NAD+ phosphorylase [Thermoanaerobaculia bacterium]
SSLDPLLFTWETDRPFVRCHNIRFGPAEFNPGKGSGRFHPFSDAQGDVVPTLYVADTLEGALAETVFHNVPVQGPGKRLPRYYLDSMVASTLVCARDLILAQLFGFGLRRLGLSRLKLIEVPESQYPRTATWARALHACDSRIDGLIWVSRQNDGTRSIILFGDRVPSSALRSIKPPLPLRDGPGFKAVVEAADQGGILLYG